MKIFKMHKNGTKKFDLESTAVKLFFFIVDKFNRHFLLSTVFLDIDKFKKMFKLYIF